MCRVPPLTELPGCLAEGEWPISFPVALIRCPNNSEDERIHFHEQFQVVINHNVQPEAFPCLPGSTEPVSLLPTSPRNCL